MSWGSPDDTERSGGEGTSAEVNWRILTGAHRLRIQFADARPGIVAQIVRNDLPSFTTPTRTLQQVIPNLRRYLNPPNLRRTHHRIPDKVLGSLGYLGVIMELPATFQFLSLSPGREGRGGGVRSADRTFLVGGFLGMAPRTIMCHVSDLYSNPCPCSNSI